MGVNGRCRNYSNPYSLTIIDDFWQKEERRKKEKKGENESKSGRENSLVNVR